MFPCRHLPKNIKTLRNPTLSKISQSVELDPGKTYGVCSKASFYDTLSFYFLKDELEERYRPRQWVTRIRKEEVVADHLQKTKALSTEVKSGIGDKFILLLIEKVLFRIEAPSNTVFITTPPTRLWNCSAPRSCPRTAPLSCLSPAVTGPPCPERFRPTRWAPCTQRAS